MGGLAAAVFAAIMSTNSSFVAGNCRTLRHNVLRKGFFRNIEEREVYKHFSQICTRFSAPSPFFCPR
jgi:hypothetical protein